MMGAKERALALIDELPEDATLREIVEDLAFQGIIERGLDDSVNDRVITEKELEKEIERW
ncbi:MAG: hypothetical protein NTX50_30605 [Candidatus Sumerlaeota bacterium]|nr:hypothetical protein [Candidatus Sumerlaeota bacterium]